MTGKFLGCIADAEAQGLDKASAEEARETYHEAFEAAAQVLGPDEADRAAGKAVMDDIAAKALRQRQLQALSVRARRAALESAAAYKTERGYSGVKALGGKGGKPPKDGWTQGGAPPPKGPWSKGGVMADWLKELVDGSGGIAGASGASVKGRYQAVYGSLQAKMADLMDRFETGSGLPIRGAAVLDNVVREAFGEETRDAAAKALARTWAETADHARKLFNAAGGAIGKLDTWGLPQSHDPLSVRAAGREGWVEAILPRLDRARMVDAITKLPFSEKRLRAVLGQTWDQIVSNGAVGQEAGEHLGSGMLANQRAESRFLVFRDADTWLAYAKDFGHGDPYATMMGHLDGMARDIAQMQVLGPNPAAQFDWLARTALIEARAEQALPGVKPSTMLKSAEGDVGSARKMFGLFTGDLNRPYGSTNAIAKVGAATRALLSGVQLGGAVINDVTSNPVFAAQVRAFVGLSGAPDFKAWFGHVVSANTRKTARRAGFILDSAREKQASAVREYLRDQTVGRKIVNGANAFSRLLPTWVQRAAFLESNFRASRWSFQHEFMGLLADRAGQGLEQLAKSKDAGERAFAQILGARGFTPAEWDLVRAVTPEEPEKGATFISPMAVAQAHGDELGWRVAEMIERETRDAVPEPSLWAHAQLLGETRPGTIQGEFARSAAAYRSFTVTQTYRWTREFMQRGLEAAQGGGLPWQARTAALAAPMLAGLTLSGAAAVWIKDIVKGNDPRPLWDEADPEEGRKRAMRFWAQALAQSGGQGILGDFLNSMQARNGKGISGTALGAPLGFLADTYQLTAGNADKALSGQPTNVGRDSADYLRRYSPLSSLWWARAAWDRSAADQLQKLLDPDAEADFQRKASALQRDYGSEAWWPHGAVLPERAPNVAAVAGGS